MTCPEIQARLSALLAGEHEAGEAVNDHLAGCRPCSEYAAKLYLQHRALSEISAERSIDEILGRIRVRLPAPRRTLRTILVAAAAGLMAAVTLFLVLRPKPREEVPATTAEVKPEPPLPKRENPVAPPPSVAENPETEPEKTARETPPKPPVVPRPVKRPPPPVVRNEPDVPAPKPEPTVEKPAVPDPAPPPTVAAVATIEDVSGEITAGAQRFRAGQPLGEGSGLQAVGPLSFARLKFADGTAVDVWGDTVLRSVTEGQGPGKGKRVVVEKGTVVAEVVKQPLGRSMVLATPQGEARVLGTVLSVRVDPEGSTRVEVEEGKVEVQRASDRRVVSVLAGHYAVAAPGVDLVARPLLQQAKKKGPAIPPKVDPAKVDEAVKKGVGFLRARFKAGDAWETGAEYGGIRFEPLVLWTFVHAGVPENDPDFEALFQKVLERPMQRTYEVSLLAMILEELDRVRYQARIAQCAQFLLDNQCTTGGWNYGKPSPFADKLTPTGSGASRTAKKSAVVRKIAVHPRGDGGGGGDNSNSQYAALGLRACHDAGIVLPKEVIDRAVKYWSQGQKKDTAGWCYCRSSCDHEAYGSMTAGALGSLVIYHHLLSEPWMKDDAVVKGLEWLTRNFSVTENPKGAPFGNNPAFHHRYYLYSLERFGTLYGTESVGTHEWYVEGAKELLQSQRGDGAWVPKAGQSVWDTCFAILFLRRATRPLVDVESVDPKKRR